MAQSYDVVVVGGGPGGYVAAIRASQLGMKTACVEAKHLGGICLNWGCIPTKSLLKNAEVWETIQHAADYGVTVDNASFDFPAIIRRSRGIAERMSKGVAFLFKKYDVTHISARGKLLGRGKLGLYDTEDVQTDTIETKHIIMATGARPRGIPGIEFDGRKIISYFEAMSLDKLPESLIVLGAGAIGVEFAYFYNALGTKVTIVEMLPHLLPIEDEDVSKELERAFRKKKIAIKTNAKVEGIEHVENGVKVHISSKKGKEILEGDLALMSVGVQGNIENNGLESAGIQLERGYINSQAGLGGTYYLTNEYAITANYQLFMIESGQGHRIMASVNNFNGSLGFTYETGDLGDQLGFLINYGYELVPGLIGSISVDYTRYKFEEIYDFENQLANALRLTYSFARNWKIDLEYQLLNNKFKDTDHRVLNHIHFIW